jgi:hypothetical protein
MSVNFGGDWRNMKIRLKLGFQFLKNPIHGWVHMVMLKTI